MALPTIGWCSLLFDCLFVGSSIFDIMEVTLHTIIGENFHTYTLYKLWTFIQLSHVDALGLTKVWQYFKCWFPLTGIKTMIVSDCLCSSLSANQFRKIDHKLQGIISENMRNTITWCSLGTVFCNIPFNFYLILIMALFLLFLSYINREVLLLNGKTCQHSNHNCATARVSHWSNFEICRIHGKWRVKITSLRNQSSNFYEIWNLVS